MKIFSFSPFGYEGALVSVEIDLRRGIPAIDIVGLADGAVKESRERMKSAIRNSGFDFPPERVLISLSPADLKKEGAGFDLAIAIAVLIAKSKENDDLCFTEDDSILIMGELELNGKVRPVRAVHAAASTAFSYGIKKCIVPFDNKNEALEIPEMEVYGAENLAQAYFALENNSNLFSKKEYSKDDQNGIPKDAVKIHGIYFPAIDEELDYKDVHGQENLIRALQIAAAGGHNLLAFGPPGCGKTLSLQRFPSLLPFLNKEESQAVTRIYSISGLLPINKDILRTAPFRMPHQTSTIEGICGGGPKCNPGEISLAHNGTLFLDEACEFRTSVLQMLRVPLESGSITLSRAGRTTTFPANFQLLMSTNPCPCGNYGSKEKICLCSARSIELYWKKFSAPLLDRIDLRVQVDTNKELINKENSYKHSTSFLREEIAIARKIQEKRQNKKNAQLNNYEISAFCKLDEESLLYLNQMAEKNNFSPRAINSCIKLARTIADMKEKEKIDLISIEEACLFRKSEGGINSSFI